MALWKPYLEEYLGTTFFVLVVILSNCSPLWSAVGLGVAMYLTAKGSGGYLNPAVSLAGYLHKDLSAKKALWYSVAQLAGGATAYFAHSCL